MEQSSSKVLLRAVPRLEAVAVQRFPAPTHPPLAVALQGQLAEQQGGNGGGAGGRPVLQACWYARVTRLLLLGRLCFRP